MKENTKKALYESIMQKVSQQVVEMLNESKQLNENIEGTSYFIELRIPSYKYDVRDSYFYIYTKCSSYPLELVQKGYGPRDRDIYKLTDEAYVSAKAYAKTVNACPEILRMKKEAFDSENGHARWIWNVVCEGGKAESLYEKYAEYYRLRNELHTQEIYV